MCRAKQSRLGNRIVSALYGVVDFPHGENRFNLLTDGKILPV
jgi:hypothetical protein